MTAPIQEAQPSAAPSQPLLALPYEPATNNGQQQATAADDPAAAAGDSLKLDTLGPVVVNEDGTISRISNWAELGAIEREKVDRLILKRNRARLERLQNKEAVAATDDVPQS